MVKSLLILVSYLYWAPVLLWCCCASTSKVMENTGMILYRREGPNKEDVTESWSGSAKVRKCLLSDSITSVRISTLV